MNLHICFGQNENKFFIDWQKDVLTPSNFTIIPDSIETGKAGAATVTRFLYSFYTKPSSDGGVQVNFSVRNTFYRKDSWFKAGFINDTSLLKHEQMHFDLAELYARKIAKAIAEKKASKNIKEELHKITNVLSAELEKQQKLFDEQTEHGLKKEEQVAWHNFINQELERHSAYASKKVVYNI
ncbi:DUF922 domain-containing protein [Pontibacter populi]|uniref:DUF922 domain-containing protein n=1 Tax=Pontibacter populi TaxID=890055 RepID=A0ABV1RP57_9BACT